MSWDRITQWKDVLPWGLSLMCYWALEAENLLLHYSQRNQSAVKHMQDGWEEARQRRGLLGQEGRHSKRVSLKQDWNKLNRRMQMEPNLQHTGRGVIHRQCLWPPISRGRWHQKRGKKETKNKLFRWREWVGYRWPPMTTVCLEALGSSGMGCRIKMYLMIYWVCEAVPLQRVYVPT